LHPPAQRPNARIIELFKRASCAEPGLQFPCECSISRMLLLSFDQSSADNLKMCDKPKCETCRCIEEVREMPKVVAATSTEAYIKHVHEAHMPIAIPLGSSDSDSR